MSDIRKRVGRKGVTYQVRHPSKATKSGYAYATFGTRKEAAAFVESGKARNSNGIRHSEIKTVDQAVDKWLDICEKEGTDGNEPVTTYTLKNYKYYAEFMRAYPWDKRLSELTPPDIVKFRSWLLTNCPSRYVARKTLTYFHRVLGEMSLRGFTASNVASGVSISQSSRYETPVTPPTVKEFREILAAADRLANSKNKTVANAWKRYRPMVYLAGDTGMRPGEYLALPLFNVTREEVKVDRAVERNGDKISVTKTPAGMRWIDLSPEVADMVLHYGKTHAVKNDYDLVFPTDTGRWQSIINWRKLGFAAVCREAGLIEAVEIDGRKIERAKYAPYDLRHFYASMLIERRVSLKRIQTLMGHTNIATTLNVYGHLIERAESSGERTQGMISSVNPRTPCGESVARENQPIEIKQLETAF